MTLHFLIKILTFQFQIISVYKTVHYFNIQRKLTFNFFKVQRSVHRIGSMLGYRVYTAWVNRGTVLLGAHTDSKPTP